MLAFHPMLMIPNLPVPDLPRPNKGAQGPLPRLSHAPPGIRVSWGWYREHTVIFLQGQRPSLGVPLIL